tara:strand:- start:101 stop:349 length:249 start_codon:yes stop_codon:yes gene_type:complete
MTLSKEERWDAVLQKHRERFKVGDMVVVNMRLRGFPKRGVVGMVVARPWNTGAAWVTKVDVLLEGTIHSVRVGYVTKIEANV